MDYSQIPAYPDGGKPTRYKDWITKIIQEIQDIKGTPNHYDEPPISLYQLSSQGNTVREFSISSNLFQIEDESGLYKYRLNHGLKSIDYSIDIVDNNNQSVTHSISKISENEIDIYLINNVDCKASITLLTKIK